MQYSLNTNSGPAAVQPMPEGISGINPAIKRRIKLKPIGPNLSILCANVCSISNNQSHRRFKLQTIIGHSQPDISILIETNLTSNWNPYPQLYSCFRTKDDINCGILILVKSCFSPKLLTDYTNKALCIELSTINMLVIGVYTPKYTDINLGLNLLKSWIKNKHWIAFSDNEGYISKFAAIGTYHYIPKYSRKSKTSFYVTDAIYGNVKLFDKRTLSQISDHFFLSCKFNPGINIHSQLEKHYKRKDILYWATKSCSKIRQEILRFWPSTPLSKLLPNRVPKTKSKRILWVPNLSANSTTNELKDFCKNYWKRTEDFINNCIVNNNMKKLAQITRSLLGYNSNKKLIKGVTTEDGKQLVGNEAISHFSKFYEKLFSSCKIPLKMPSSLSISHLTLENFSFAISKSKSISNNPSSIKFSKHKALGTDLFPDELLQDEVILYKLNQWAIRKFKGEPIESIYNQGRLILLNKSESEYPLPSQTRPIVILSPVRKYLESLWYAKYKGILWENIGNWQVGFRPNHSTQENIVKLNTWLIKNRKGAIGIFVDVYKAFDSIQRMQILEIVRNCNIDSYGLQVLYNLLNNMSLNYEKNTFSYMNGVSQGSVISPILFNLVYDLILKEADASGWFILAFADDLFIGITSIAEYESVMSWLDSWPTKVNLKVNKDKTKEFRIGKFSKTNGKFEKVDTYKYLGVEISASNIVKSARKRCRNTIENSCRIAKAIRGANPKSNYFCLLWWFVSNVLYKTIHGIPCNFYKPDYIVEYTIKKIRKFAKIPPRLSNKMLEEFFGFHIKQTILQILHKLKLCVNEENVIVLTTNNKRSSSLVWNKIISLLSISPTAFTAWICHNTWKKNKKLKCKICHEKTSLIHLVNHGLLSQDTCNFLFNVGKGSILAAVDNLSDDYDKACFKLFLILSECITKWDFLINKLSYIDVEV